MTVTTGAILAGGLGTRLRSVVSDRPKVLAMVLDRPFLAYLMDLLVAAGVDRIVLLAGYRSEQIEATFGSSYCGASLAYSVEAEPLGTGGAVRLALPKLFTDARDAGGRSAVFVLNGDSYCGVNLSAFRESHERQQADASLVLAQVPDAARFGTVERSADGWVERFLEKQGLAQPGWINAGIYLLNRPLVEQIPPGRAVSIERELFPAWLSGRRVFGFEATQKFLDIGTPESYAAAANFFSQAGP